MSNSKMKVYTRDEQLGFQFQFILIGREVARCFVIFSKILQLRGTGDRHGGLVKSIRLMSRS
jgi:hypothetical protein